MPAGHLTNRQRREAIALAGEIGVAAAALRFGVSRSTVRTWRARAARDELAADPPPAWPAIPYAVTRAVPGMPELARRHATATPYEPADPLTGRQLLARIWPDRTAAA